jgi:ParB-like chromosome segregation protein Spo0J
MYDRMIHDHGYSIRRLADKLGKDKGYVENRLRLADAPEEIRELVSVRKDTLSHAYELLKVGDEKKRRRLAAKVASGELSLVKLRERIEGRPVRVRPDADDTEAFEVRPGGEDVPDNGNGVHAEEDGWTGTARAADIRDDSLIQARHQLADAVEELVGVLRAPDLVRSIPEVDRANLAKYLTIAKLKLENAIAMVRSGDIE